MRNNSGQGVLAVMILVVLVGVIMGTVLVFMTGSESRFRVLSAQNAKAFYAAEAGIDFIVYRLNLTNGTTYPYSIIDVSLGSAVFDVSIETTSIENRFKINSIGYYPDRTAAKTKRGIECFLQFSGGEADTVWDYAVCSKTDIIMFNSATTQSTPTANQGHIRTNGNIELKNSSIVNGDAIATGTVDIKDSALVTGEVVEGADALTFPTIDTSGLEDDATAASYDTTWTGASTFVLSYINTTITRTYFYKSGHFRITYSTITFNTYLKVGSSGGNKDFTIEDSVVYLSSTAVYGNFTITGRSVVYLNGTVYSTGDITFDDDAELEGQYRSMFTNDQITFDGDSKVHNTLLMTAAAGNSILLKNGAEAQSVVCYAPEGDIEIQNDAVLSGSIVGNVTNVKNSAQIRLDEEVEEKYDVPTGGGLGGGTENTYFVTWEEYKP